MWEELLLLLSLVLSCEPLLLVLFWGSSLLESDEDDGGGEGEPGSDEDVDEDEKGGGGDMSAEAGRARDFVLILVEAPAVVSDEDEVDEVDESERRLVERSASDGLSEFESGDGWLDCAENEFLVEGG